MSVCTFPGCEAKMNARGLCHAHYVQWRRGTELRPVRRMPHPSRFVKPTDQETAWLAGLLEGEGCFSQVGRQVRITLEMVDKDIVRRAGLLMCSAHTLHLKPARDVNHQDKWIVSSGGHTAQDIMRAIRPHMGLRRGDKIDRMLA